MTEEIKGLFEEIKTGLEGKTKEQIETEVKALEEKYNAMVDEKVEGLAKAEELKTLEDEYKKATDAMQDHIDKLDVKFKEVQVMKKQQGDAIKSLITENFDQIKTVNKSNSISIKAAGDMTLTSNLTGDQPRDYSFDVAAVPNQLVNLADLVGSVAIQGGTYTFPRESGSEGAIGAQTEGSSKSQIDYDITMVDVNTDFIAGFAVYSRKMANNLPFLESFLPGALRRDYWKAENSAFNTTLAAGVTASTELITGQNKAEMILAEMAKLEGANFMPNAIVLTPADWYSILEIEKSTGAGYGLPGLTVAQNGAITFNGVPVIKATWLAANKYYVGDFTRVKKVITEGLSVGFFEQDSDNVRKNNITARVEAQVGLAIERTDAIIYGDFTAV